MDLLEYQAKALFADHGIPVLPSQKIDSVSDIRNLRVPYPVMLKSQVRTHGRGRVGGIRRATNTIDAIAAAQSIFRLPIRGHCPDVLLAEAHYPVQRELYLAIILDHNARRPLLLGSATGGMDADLSPDQVVHILVEEEFSPFYVRQLALGMGLRGELMRTVAAIAEKMYQLFVQRDLDLVEINPLAVGADGEVMALDGKVRVNDNALARHPMMCQRLRQAEISGETAEKTETTARGVHGQLPTGCAVPWSLMDGTVSVVCNGMGLALATVDGVVQAGGQAAGYANVGWVTEGNGQAALGDRVLSALETAIAARDQATLLINLVGPTVDGLQIVQQLIHGLRATGHWAALSHPPQRAIAQPITPTIARTIDPRGGTVPEQREQSLGQEPSNGEGAVVTRSLQRTLESSPPSLDLTVPEYQRQWPKVVLHCSNLDHDAAEALAAPYPIWLADTLEIGIKIAVDLSA